MADAAALLALGGVLLEWSRRRLGRILPGLLAYFTILAAYFDVPCHIVAQRDRHTTLLAAVALMTLQTWPGRGGRWAATVAAAFTIRPHLVVFLRALALAAWQGGDGRARSTHGDGGRRELRNGVERSRCSSRSASRPLVVAGILDDLLRNLRTASYGGPHSTFGPERALKILSEEIASFTTAGMLIVLAALSVRSPWRWTARVWLAALIGVIVYRPLHPVDDAYLQMPLKLVTAIAWAVPVAWNVRISLQEGLPVRGAFLGLLAILALMYESVPLREPWNCSFSASFDTGRAWARGGGPSMPPGAYLDFDPDRPPAYSWDDYFGLLSYIREFTGPETVVANVFRRLPLSPVNGPMGRPSPFLAESGSAGCGSSGWISTRNSLGNSRRRGQTRSSSGSRA